MVGAETLSVVIPSYQRPTWIARALGSLHEQSRRPDEVIVVLRDTDQPSHDALAALQARAFPFELRRALVSEPGFIPPVKTGLEAAGGDVIAIMDDDAEAADGWADRILAGYADPQVGAVGGRCINTTEAGPTPVPETNRVGYVNLRGQFIGQMFYRPTFSTPLEVDFLMGGNMSFRKVVAKCLEFDMTLNRNVAQGYEVDLGLQTRLMGWKVLFDPLIAIRHYSAPRPQVGMRASDNDSAQWYAFNQARVALRRLPLARRWISFGYQIVLGERRAPGFVPFVLPALGRKLGFDVNVARAALKGRALALRSVLAP